MPEFDDRRRYAPGLMSVPQFLPLQRLYDPAQVESQRPPPERAVPEWLPLTPERARSPLTAQRRAVAPTLTAATLSHEDRQAVQRSADQVVVQRQSVQRLEDELAGRGLRPESLELLSRRTPAPEPKLPVVPVQERLGREDACVQDALALLRRDARYIPLHTRAELAGDAIERGRQQGLDVDAVRLAVLAQVTDGMQRDVLQAMFQRVEQGVQQRQQHREHHAFQLQHAQLQRAAKTVEQAHDLLSQQTAIERIQARRGGGQPLPNDIRKQLELGLNHDLAGVRIHTDAEADQLARSLQATAFTSGKDIFFRTGEYNPSSKLDLIAHEAAHVQQQDLGLVGPGVDPDAGLEQQAQQFGAGQQEGLTVTGPAPTATGQTVQRLKAPTPTPEFWNTVQWRQQFTGTLGKAHITLSLTVNDEQVQGTYSYAGHTGQLQLRGTFNPDAVILTLNEQDPQHPAATAAQLQLTPGGASQLTGTWTGHGKTLPVMLSLMSTPKMPDAPQSGSVNPVVVQAIIDAIAADAKLHPNTNEKNNLGGIRTAVLQAGITKTIAEAERQQETDPRAIALLIANIAQESSFNENAIESLYYTPRSSPETVYRRRFHGDPRQAAPYLYNSKNMANYVYANEQGNGNEASGDGFKYRGSGLIQVTYRNNFKKWNTIFKDQGWTVDGVSPDFEQHPELVHHPEAAYRIAVYGVLNGVFTSTPEPVDAVLSRLPEAPSSEQFAGLRTRYVGTHDPMLAGRVSTVILKAIQGKPLMLKGKQP